MNKNNNTPELRFPEFTGEWERKKLSEVTTWASGGTPPKDNDSYWNGNIPWISASSMRGLEYSDSSLKITQSGLKNGSKLATKGTLLILVRGSMLFNTIPIGIAVIDVAFNQDVKSISVNEESTSKYVLYWFIFLEPKVLSMVTGTGIGAGKLDLAELKSLDIPLPSLPEQQKIATFLSAIDDKLQALKKKKALLEQYKKGVMQAIFSQQLRFKDVNGEDYPVWELKKLGEVATFFKGKGISKNEISEHGVTECIRYGELYTRYNEVISKVHSKTDVSIDNLVLSETNDVIIPASGETQIDIATASCVMKSGVALGGDLNIIRTPNNGVFLSYYLNNRKKIEIANLAQGSSVIHLYSSQLSSLDIELPSLPEQTQIANFLTSLDEKLTQCQSQIEHTDRYKKGLLQKMFC